MSRTHKVYALKRADGMVKIGTTIDLDSRIRVLSSSHGPLEIVRILNGDVRLERKLHSQFKTRHQFGEWFKADAAMLHELRTMPTADELAATTSDMRAEWDRAEAEKAEHAANIVQELIAYRRGRTGVTRAQAIEDLSADYGLPISFLTHLQKRKATTVSAHGLSAIGAAFTAEMKVFLAKLEAEMAELKSMEIPKATATGRSPK